MNNSKHLTTKYANENHSYAPSKTEKEIIEFWEKNNIFLKSVNKNTDKFIFFDGPPFANGMPHYGHLLTGFVKDTIARFQTMNGKKVERKFGWDCHGLPAEMSVEKELGISGKLKIREYGIGNFNNHCRESATKYVKEWKKYVQYQCRWVDFENSYKTMDKDFMESVFWVFKQLYDKGLVYESSRVVPYSWKCETPLSNFETKMDNSYREKTSKTVTIFFELLSVPKKLEGIIKSCKCLAWTTTPWTLPSNLAIAAGRNIEYCCVISDDIGYICSKSYSNKIISDKKIVVEKIVDINPEDIIGLNYKPLFPYFSTTQNAFTILEAKFVTSTDGTGLVHIAPGFGEEDFNLCLENNINVVCPIDDSGKFTKEVVDFQNLQVFEANDPIIIYLKKSNNWYETNQYIHNYPHCWRTDTPLIYREMKSWYIEVTKIKDRMRELNKQINWFPSNVKFGQFDSWLKGARDWSVSRNRFWGTPIPIWKSTDENYPRIDVYGSIKEIEKDFNIKIEELHLPYLDTITRQNPDDPTGKSLMQRVPEVFDCWFESGSMPYAQQHYPFNSESRVDFDFPADFVSEYIAQTRGWFYTMLVLSTALFDSIPFKNCMCHGVVLDKKGQKLSKRLNNYPDPMEIFNKYGSDSLRFLMLSSNVISGGTLMLDQKAEIVQEVLKTVINQIWSGYYFFTVYANIDNIDCSFISESPNIIDMYIIIKCDLAIAKIKESLETYNTQSACYEIEVFFDAFNNWYIRRNKQRFWKEEIDDDKKLAYNTIYTVFHKMCRAFAPLIPALAEKIWQGMRYQGESVHLANFPEVNKNYDKNIISVMEIVRGVCNATLSLRNTHKIRVRQPLSKIVIYHKMANQISDTHLKIIQEEVNVKNISIVLNTETVATKKIKPNFSLISKRIPKEIPNVMLGIKENKWELLQNENIIINKNIELFKKEFEIILETKKDITLPFDNNKGVIEIDTTITHDLLLEGYARDLIRHIQQNRKKLEFSVSEKVDVYVYISNKVIEDALKTWEQHIKKQVFANSIKLVSDISQVDDKYIEAFNEVKISICKSQLN